MQDLLKKTIKNQIHSEKKPSANEPLGRTAIDEFNLEILRSKDWGKSQPGATMTQFFKMASKPSNKDLKGSLG